MGHDGELLSDALNQRPSYENWGFGEPSDKYTGGRCVTMAPGVTVWSVDRCGQSHNKICMKQVGRQCPKGWIYHTGENGGKCYQYFISGGAHESWYTANNYCKAIGAKVSIQKFDRNLIIFCHVRLSGQFGDLNCPFKRTMQHSLCCNKSHRVPL